MRCFLGISPPAHVATRLAEIAEGCPLGRPVPEENIHATLCFLDDVPHETMEELDDALTGLRAASLDLRVEGLGAFGGGHGPRALYAHVPAEPGLTELNKRVRAKARGVGINLRHKQFVPHITLVRFRHGTEETPEFQRFVGAHAGLALGPIRVTSYALFASHLGKGGAQYEELARYPLT